MPNNTKLQFHDILFVLHLINICYNIASLHSQIYNWFQHIHLLNFPTLLSASCVIFFIHKNLPEKGGVFFSLLFLVMKVFSFPISSCYLVWVGSSKSPIWTKLKSEQLKHCSISFFVALKKAPSPYHWYTTSFISKISKKFRSWKDFSMGWSTFSFSSLLLLVGELVLISSVELIPLFPTSLLLYASTYITHCSF